MIEKLNKIRTPDRNILLKNKIINTILIFALGIALGIIAKWLDNLAINNSIWWQQIIGRINLNNVLSEFGIWLFIALAISVYSKTQFRAALNVFLFFVGMNVSYHLCTIMFSGFNPTTYMMIWYGLTFVSPLLAIVCWYSKGESVCSIIISSLIIGIMLKVCFSVGLIYFGFKSIIDTLIFIGSVSVLYTKSKNISISFICGIVVGFIISGFIYF
ncbi:hypothetical protein [Streptococcus canis]|uniref:hypothetical protein n=1 Tax=Streptococcus canis TaxID=1329 RepID=UPI0012E6FB78|nr:hypothetical protein [Streptococcus canis]QJD12594.1 hypothetical protein GE024_07000 [Streptococcus canis]